jgi:hypothetical protein
MRHRLRETLVLIILLFVMGTKVSADEIAPGSVIGRIVNGTDNDRPVPGLEITLSAVSMDQLQDSWNVTSDRTGYFTFRGLREEPAISYALALTYKGVEYFRDRIRPNRGSTADQIALRVYEVSQDASNLQVGNHHLIIVVGDSCLQVQEVVSLRNESPYTYVSDAAPSIKFSLPVGAQGVIPGGQIAGDDTVVQENLILATLPVRPEGEEILFQYHLELKDGSYRFTRTIEYPTERLDVFLAIPGASLSSDELGTAQTVTIEGVEYQYLGGKNLPAGSLIGLNIRLPVERERINIQDALFLIASLAAAAALIFPFIKGGDQTVSAGIREQRSEREELIEGIARLDEEFAEGRFEPGAYHAARAGLKNRLLRLSMEHTQSERDS